MNVRNSTDMLISRIVLSEQIKQRLIDEIMAGDYVPGDRLVESALAKRFNVSQSPVREALKGLEEMGLVTQEPYKGTMVRAISDEDIYEASTVRAALESIAAGLAAKRCTSKDIEILEDIFAQMTASAEKGDDLTRLNLNNRFHAEIIRISGHKLIAKLSQMLLFASWSHLKGVMFKDPAKHHLVDRHRLLIDALAAHDAAAAQELMRMHIEDNMPRFPRGGEDNDGGELP